MPGDAVTSFSEGLGKLGDKSEKISADYSSRNSSENHDLIDVCETGKRFANVESQFRGRLRCQLGILGTGLFVVSLRPDPKVLCAEAE